MKKHELPMHGQTEPQGQISPEPLLSKVFTTTTFQHFFNTVSSGGFLLIAAAFASLLWSNANPESYNHFWHQELAVNIGGIRLSHSLGHWINDGLMTLFFFTVGLEIKREMLVGALADPREAALPAAAALGGMILPAAIYFLFNATDGVPSGWGIPMATDIAFSLAILSTLGSRIPLGLRIFLTAFAIVDDLGAIVVIALFYTPEINLPYLVAAIVVVGTLFVLNRLWVRTALAYVIIGALLWILVANSGLHATVTGVIVAMFIPARGKYNTDVFMRMVRERLEEIRCEGEHCGYTIMQNRAHLEAVHGIHEACNWVETPLQKMEHAMETWIAYLVLPLFALANTGVVLGDLDLGAALLHPITTGIVAGLVIGKAAGVVTFTWLAAAILRVRISREITWPMLTGVGFLGGVGFTMSMFISALSFATPLHLEYAKVGIIAGSLVSGGIGYGILRLSTSSHRAEP